MDREQTKEFIKLMQSLNEQQQTGLLLIIQGMQLLERKKRRINRRSCS